MALTIGQKYHVYIEEDFTKVEFIARLLEDKYDSDHEVHELTFDNGVWLECVSWNPEYQDRLFQPVEDSQ